MNDRKGKEPCFLVALFVLTFFLPGYMILLLKELEMREETESKGSVLYFSGLPSLQTLYLHFLCDCETITFT